MITSIKGNFNKKSLNYRLDYKVAPLITSTWCLNYVCTYPKLKATSQISLVALKGEGGGVSRPLPQTFNFKFKKKK